jgi:hypothetical protein
MWRAALRRIAVIVVSVVGATAAISVSLGALAHRNLAHSIAVGYYVAGVGALLGTLAFGLRGPMRREVDEDATRPSGSSLFFGGARKMRPTTAGERFEARRNSLVFFVVGIFLLALGAAVDPTRSLV